MQNELRTIRGVLDDLRRRIRSAWRIRGVAISIAALCAAIVASFALDYFLDLPLAVRAIHLALVLVALAFVVRWALVRPLATPTEEADLAQAVEHGARELRDRLVSALDFEKRLADESEPESRELMAEVVRDAAANAARLDAGLLVDTRPARRAVTWAALAASIVIVVAAAVPDEFGLWIKRGLLLSADAWPRRTHIHVLDFPVSEPKIVTRGDDLRVVAVVEGDRPAELLLHYEELADVDPTKPDAKPAVVITSLCRMYALEGEEGRFAYDFHAVSASFRFWVTGGDDQDDDPVHSVEALVPPRVASISGKIVYPEYAGLPDAEVRDANFEVLKGSKVEMQIVANMPLAGARIVPTDVAQATVVPLAEDGRSMTLTFQVEKPVDFHLELTAKRGHTNRADDDVFHLRAVDDRPPELHVLYPPARLYRTPNGIVPIKFVAKDDFRVEKVVLDVALGSAPAGSSVLWPLEGRKPDGKKRVDSYRPLDLMQFAGDKGPTLKPGDVLHLVLRAFDSHGNETASADYGVEIHSSDDLERQLSQKQSTLREDLQLLRRNQQRVRSGVAELRAGAAPGGVLPASRGRDLQVDQGRVTNDLGQFLGGIHEVFNSYVLCRVFPGATTDKLLPLYDEALSKPSDDEVFPAELYRRIVEDKRAERLYDPDILGALLDIMDLGERALVEKSPEAYRALAAFVGEKAAAPAELEKAEKASVELAELLVEMDQRMQRWGDLNLLIEMARGIHEIEMTLSKDPAGTKGLAPK